MMDCAPEAQGALLNFTSGSAMSSRLVNQGNCRGSAAAAPPFQANLL